MTLIEWQDEFSVGVASVDFEHRELITLINALDDDATAGCDAEHVIAALGEIYVHIASHFALEEKYMRDSVYPEFAAHKADHESLLDQLRDIMDRVEDDGSFDRERLSRELGAWFTEHFSSFDARLHHHQR